MQSKFEALADQTRREILKYLSNNDMTAGEIAANFNMSKPSISHHLSVLKRSNLIISHRAGQEIIYSLNKEVLQKFMLDLFSLFE
jgi:ArsR family transcriptional regulator